jgi:CRP/FNR family transcriptional regulator, dissimilatory nitrate respiration regulator
MAPMAAPEVAAFLRSLPIFRGLDPQALAKVAALSKFSTFETGQRVFNAGERCEAFYAVRTGGVKLYKLSGDGREQVMSHVGPSRTFAEAALLSLGVFPVSAAATETPTEVLTIRGAPFLELFRDDDNLVRAMVASLSSRLHMLIERVEELTIANAAARVARHLLKLPAKGPADAPVVELPMAKKDLAQHLAITPETLSRLLRRWQDAGLVRSERRELTLLDPARLLALADGEASDS